MHIVTGLKCRVSVKASSIEAFADRHEDEIVWEHDMKAVLVDDTFLDTVRAVPYFGNKHSQDWARLKGWSFHDFGKRFFVGVSGWHNGEVYRFLHHAHLAMWSHFECLQDTIRRC